MVIWQAAIGESRIMEGVADRGKGKRVRTTRKVGGGGVKMNGAGEPLRILVYAPWATQTRTNEQKTKSFISDR